ncbi:uncharacterized protein LOC142175325 [Nicotiana tabacum]|uniref:Uncharacterized protein LOC142175325 n=1 Tax=Nicotiana tabacum TaxID=4097 RepID=A0AC58TLC9_TOBAC
MSLPHEDPQQHILNLFEINDTYITNGVTPDYVRLTLFPFSLLGEAKRWLKVEPANSITSWNDLARKFLARFFPSGKTAKIRTWERFKGLLRDCPHHNHTNEVLAHTFIKGLHPETKIMVDVAAGGQVLEKSFDEIYALLNKFSKNNPDWQGEMGRHTVQKSMGVLELDIVSAFSAQVVTLVNQVNKMTLVINKQQAQPVQQVQIFCEVQNNIPLVDILQEVPKYAKYIKDIVANKKRLTEFETVALTEECSSRIQSKQPQKLKDTGSLTIQISIGKHAVGRALCDLGASINLMPLSVFIQLELGESCLTTMILQLVDRSLAHPEEVIEYVLVQVGSFIFPGDFINLDYEPDQEVPFILGSLFLATGRAIIDVCEEKITMRVGDRVEVFNMYKALRLPAHYEELSIISVVESEVTLLVPYMSPKDPLERSLIRDEEDSEDEMMEEIEQLDRCAGRKIAQSTSREHKKAIGWTIADIKGISPSFCMHKIFLEDGHCPSVEQQRRLNLIVKEVMKKEVIKWLDAGIIFPISNNNWRMSFGFNNALATFQRCMMTIFTDIVEKFVKVFMNDFSVFGYSYDDCLKNLSKVLARCEETNLVLNWESAILWYKKASSWAIECQGMALKLIRLRLLEKDVTFNFDEACLKAFEELKKKLVAAPIITAPDWSLPFQLMCDTSDHAIGGVLGQRKDKMFYSICYASKTLNDAQLNYTTTEKELLAIVIFDVEIRYWKGTEKQVAGHLSRLENHEHVEEGGQIKVAFPDEQLFAITQDPPPWYADYVNYIVSGLLPPEIQSEARKRFLHDVNFYYWDEPFLYKQCADQLMRRCIPEKEVELVLYDCHASPYRADHRGNRTAGNVLQSGFFWPILFKDAHAFGKKCDQCQKIGKITKRHEMPLNNIPEIEFLMCGG